MIGHDEACDERIRCGRHGRRDASAPSGQDPGAVLSRIDIDGDGDDGDDDIDGNNDDDEHEHDDDRRLLPRRAG